MFGNIYSNGFCRYTVVSDGHNSSSRSGANQVENYNQRYENKNKSHEIIGIIRCLGYSHGAVYVYFLGCRIKNRIVICLNTDSKMDTVYVSGQIEVVYYVLYNLSKSQSYDGKVVASQPQNRNSHQEPYNSSCKSAYYKGQGKSDPHRRNRFLNRHGKYTPHKCSHAHESCMT